MSTTDVVSEFFLSEDVANLSVENDDSRLTASPRWLPVERQSIMHLALALGVGQTAIGPVMQFSGEMSMLCELSAKVDAKNFEGCSCQAFFESYGDRWSRITLFEAPLSPNRKELNFTLDLSVLCGRCGRLGLRCFSLSGRPDSEWMLAILKWVAGPSDRLGLLTARTHRTRRLKTTIEHFNTTYDHEMYANRKTGYESGDTSKFTLLEKVSSSRRRKSKDLITAESLMNLPSARAAEGDNVFGYAHRVLNSLIAAKPPNFPKRIQFINQRESRPVRILSLCSGAAGIERQIIANAACPVQITLFDLNEKLMRQAAASLSSSAETSGFLGDVNELSVEQFGEGAFDIVMFVSGLHHVVEIEHVLQGIAELLTSNGEFWIVGEAIGRNGNRLWPEALEAANLVFSPLPERYRRNAFTGKVDSTVPETDFSAASFEGIRSEEIESLLLRYFDPIEMWRSNCFLWRLINPAYFSNYDLRNQEDRYVVLSFVVAEYNLWKSGGRPAQSYSVYRKR